MIIESKNRLIVFGIGHQFIVYFQINISHMNSHGDKVSYRQVGTRAQGKIQRGVNRRNHNYNNTASIPSKFETLLNSGETESNGFGNRTSRFGCSDNELPGPGSYYKNRSLVRTTKDSGSVSKLGYGSGFVSKSSRFDPSHASDVPGPGQYYDSRSEVFMKPHFNASVGMSSFARTNKVPTISTSNTPGPGQYDLGMNTSGYRSVAGSAFRSTSNRGFHSKQITPSPGQYENTLQLSKQIVDKKSGYYFISKVPRIKVSNSSNPGPGAYETSESERMKNEDVVSQARPSSVFMKPSKVKSINRNTTPGPGSYNVGVETAKHQVAASNIFKSNTTRTNNTLGKKDAKPPGPAYYKPELMNKKTFLLNATKKWV